MPHRQIKSDRRQQNAAIGTQQDAGCNRRAGRGPEPAGAFPRTSRTHLIQSGDRAIESERGKKNLQSFGECGGGVICQEWTQRRQNKSDSRRPFGDCAAGKVGNDQAGGQVDQNLSQQNCFKIAGSKQPEDRGQKSRISRQARVARHDLFYRLRQVRLPVDAVLQPVGGEVGVGARVIRDRREMEEEK